jgi:dTDP-4-amino-4,6-dideoxygalactose transaminase
MGESEQRFVAAVFESNFIAPAGPMVTAFEDQLSQLTGFCGVAALSSGSAALHLALVVADLGPGDEVWTATMTFVGGVAPVVYVGATPVFVDIDPTGLLIDLDLLETALRARRQDNGRLPRAVITTDLYGLVPDAERIGRLSQEYGFIWISDSAEAVGSYRNGRHAGYGADLAIYSFNGNKIITTSGGGALASSNRDWVERARFLSTQAKDPAPHYEHSVLGYNYRLSSVCAAIGMGQLEILQARVAARRRIHQHYRELLGTMAGVSFSHEPDGVMANRWLTTIRIDPQIAGFDAEEVRLALAADNIEARPLWKPMHLQPVFQDAPRIGGDVAQAAFETGLCLPSGSQMTAADITRVCDVVRSRAKP